MGRAAVSGGAGADWGGIRAIVMTQTSVLAGGKGVCTRPRQQGRNAVLCLTVVGTDDGWQALTAVSKPGHLEQSLTDPSRSTSDSF